MWQFVLDIIGAHIGSILTGLAGIAALGFAFFKGKSDAKKDGAIATQKEIIDALEDRSTVEDRFRNASDTERDSVQSPWQRD